MLKIKNADGKLNKRFVFLTALIVAVLALSIFAVAKYTTPFTGGFKSAQASKFFFTTSIDENDSAHPYDSAGSVRFYVYNHDDLNISETDVKFEVTITGDGAEDAVIKIDDNASYKGKITHADGVKKQADVSITLLPDGYYTIKVKSTYPYEKEYTFYYYVSDDSSPTGYIVTNHNTWSELDIYTGNNANDITIYYPGFAPDNTDERMADWVSDSNGTITGLEANAHYRLIFFGEGTFTLKQSGKTLGLYTITP